MDGEEEIEEETFRGRQRRERECEEKRQRHGERESEDGSHARPHILVGDLFSAFTF